MTSGYLKERGKWCTWSISSTRRRTKIILIEPGVCHLRAPQFPRSLCVALVRRPGIFALSVVEVPVQKGGSVSISLGPA